MRKWPWTLIHPSVLQIHTTERPPNSHWVSILDWPLTMPLPIKLINGPGAVSMNNSFELRFPLIFGPAAEQPLMGLAVDGPLVADGPGASGCWWAPLLLMGFFWLHRELARTDNVLHWFISSWMIECVCVACTSHLCQGPSPPYFASCVTLSTVLGLLAD